MRTLILMCVGVLLVSSLARAEDPKPTDETIRQQAIDLLSAGKQGAAERLVFTWENQTHTVKSMYLSAVLVRTRFDLRTADKFFDHVIGGAPGSDEAQIAAMVVAIDRRDDSDGHFDQLDNYSKAHEDDVFALWMVAVECRQLHKNKIGIARYAKLLETLDPGPSLVHQTYGNLLLDANLPEDALRQYEKAVEEEPAGWSYNTKGNALWALKRYDEAAAAYQKATELNPEYDLTWQNWASMLDELGDVKRAAEKRARLAEIRAKQQG